jgi:hypothetical protein
MKILQEELGWVYYGGKHYESVYTRFYQGYVLPIKFNVDKRRGHLSDLILSGQISRQQALAEIEKPGYDKELLSQDFYFVRKKFELDEKEFKCLMDLPVKLFKDYPNNDKLVSQVKRLVNYLRFKGWYTK